ncbi:MAG: M23 family metallopeptidase, partial [Polyangiales bacterium]
MSLGYALVHPEGIRLAGQLTEDRLCYDDASHTGLSALGMQLPGDVLDVYLADIERVFRELGLQVQSLIGPQGPLRVLHTLTEPFTAGRVDIGRCLESLAQFFEQLHPQSLRAQLGAWLERLFGEAPFLSAPALFDRLKTFALSALDLLEAPLRGGRDDLPAHRSFRVAAFFRLLIAPLEAELDQLAETIDLRRRVLAMLEPITQGLDPLLDTAQRIGRFLRETVAPIVSNIERLAGLGASVSLSTRSLRLPRAAPTPDPFDERPVPKDAPDWLTGFDIGTAIACIGWTIFDWQRSQPPGSRWTDHLAYSLQLGWQITRLIVRAVNPDWLQKSVANIDTFWFSEWGNFAIHLLLMLLGSGLDMGAEGAKNWAMSMALRFGKFYLYEFQTRAIYQLVRSYWFMARWKERPRAERQPIPLGVWNWTSWSYAFLIATILGLTMPWSEFGLQRLGGSVHQILVIVILALIGAVAGQLLTAGIFDGYDASFHLQSDAFTDVTSFFALLLTFLILVGAVVATPVADGTMFLLLFLGLIPVIPAISRAVDPTATATNVLYMIFYTGLGGGFIAGVVHMLIWWWLKDDGRDADNRFPQQPSTAAPYRLPYPAGESWLCGQGIHGIFSHLDESSTDLDNLYGHDFNEDLNRPALAARAGFVIGVTDNNANHTPNANEVRVRHMDWAPGYDPGRDDERVISSALYLHLAQNSAQVATGQLVAQGTHVAGIDDTGNSSQHHLHFHAYHSENDGAERTHPVLFSDGSLQRTRTFAHQDGRPLSMCWYESENVQVSPPPQAASVALSRTTFADGSHPHEHTLLLHVADLMAADGGFVASLETWTSVENGHQHPVSLTAEQLQTLFNGDAASGVVIGTALGHDHELTPGITFNPRATGALDLALAPGYPATLHARQAEPYDLLGEQLAFSINGRTTELQLFGAERARFNGALALDRGPAAGEDIELGGASFTRASVSGRLSARAAAHELSTQLGGDARSVRAEPVLVLETTRRGRSAELRVSPTDLARLGLPSGSEQHATGTGFTADLSAVPRAEVVALFNQALTAVAASHPILTSSLVGDRLRLQLGGAAISGFIGSSPRLGRVFTALYDPASSTLRAAGALPLGSGSLQLQGAFGPYTVELLASPARLVIDPGPAHLDPSNSAALTAQPLRVRCFDDTQLVRFSASDDTLAKVAQRIMREAEGVRATVSGSQLVVETVAGGSAVTLQLEKRAAAGGSDFSSATASGAAAPLRAGTPSLSDTSCITQRELAALAAEAVGWSHPSAAPPVAVTVSLQGARLRLAVPAGSLLAVTGSPALLAALHLPSGPAPTLESSADLPATLALPHAGFIDVAIDGVVRRVQLPGEPARLELGPITRWPQAGERVALEVNGAAVSADFTASDQDLDALAARIAAASGELSVRLAYRYTLENLDYGQRRLSLTESAGLLSAGVIDRPLPSSQTPYGRTTDHAALTAGDFASPLRLRGPVAGPNVCSIARDGDQVVITASASDALVQLTTPGSDPLAITAAGNEARSSALPAVLGTTALAYALKITTPDQTHELTCELNALPAAVRGERAVAPEALTQGVSLELVVRVPDELDPGTRRELSTTIAFDGVSNTSEALARILQRAPLLRGQLRPDGRLQLETRHGGSAWELVLRGREALVALGWSTAELAVAGRGNLPDGRRVTAEHAEAALRAALPSLTQTDSRLLTAAVSGNDVQLRSSQGVVAIDARPSSLLTRLGVVTSPGIALTSSGSFALETGFIEVRVGGDLCAAVPIAATRAVIEAPDDVDSSGSEAAQLALLTATPLRLRVDGGPLTSVPPGSASTLDDYLRSLASAVPVATFSLVAAGGGARTFRVESLRRGSSARIELQVPAGVLGYASASNPSASGTGNVPDLAQVTPLELQRLIEGAHDPRVHRQTELVAAANGGDLTLTITGFGASGARVRAVGTVPGGLGLPSGARTTPLSVVYAAALPVGQTPLELQLPDLGSINCLFYGEAARLPELGLPTNLADLNGTQLSLSVQGAPVDVHFAAVSGTAVI